MANKDKVSTQAQISPSLSPFFNVPQCLLLLRQRTADLQMQGYRTHGPVDKGALSCIISEVVTAPQMLAELTESPQVLQ